MMAKLIDRAGRLVAERQERAVRVVAAELSSLVRNASVEIDGASVVVRGARVAKQWLGDPRLRFFGRGR